MEPPKFLAGLGRYIERNREAIRDRILDATYESVPGYAGVPRDDLAAATDDSLDMVIGLYTSGRLPTVDDWKALDSETVRRRVRQGVRAKDWIAHVYVSRKEFLAAANSFGGEEDVPQAEIAAVVMELDEETHTVAAFAAAEFDAAADDLLREDQVKRDEFIGGVLRGALTPAAVRSGAAALGLDPAALYRAVRIRPPGAGSGDELLRAVLRAEPTVQPRGVWALIDGDVCGVTQTVPSDDLAEVAAGVGPVVPLEAVGSSYAVATTALDTAARFGMTGAYAIDELGALPLVAAGGRAGDGLVERFVHEVERAGSGGPALVETVAAYLEHGLQVGETAKSLHLHVNSLRKRLRRYEEVTGSSLSSMDDLAAIWAALKRRELDGKGGA